MLDYCCWVISLLLIEWKTNFIILLTINQKNQTKTLLPVCVYAFSFYFTFIKKKNQYELESYKHIFCQKIEIMLKKIILRFFSPLIKEFCWVDTKNVKKENYSTGFCCPMGLVYMFPKCKRMLGVVADVARFLFWEIYMFCY